MGKTHVNGQETCEVFQWLRTNSELGSEGSGTFFFGSKVSLGRGKKIPWNYSKFLVDDQGNVVRYLAPSEGVEGFRVDLERLTMKTGKGEGDLRI
jgi:glutathione peroxidase-family protein